MKKAVIFLVALTLSLSIILRIARNYLVGIENPTMAAWPGQVIFGFYFAILALAVQGLHILFKTRRRDSSAQALLLLVLIGLCLDLVLVNIQETTIKVDASYGLVVLWDAATFFVWLRVIDLCRPGAEKKFLTSWAVAIAPLLKLGREILFLPYPPPAWRAYLDLVFGDLAVCVWIFVPLIFFAADRKDIPSRTHVQQMLMMLVFTGCIYWLVSGIENVAFLGWSPLHALLYRTFERVGIPVPTLNFLYLVLAVVITIAVWRWNVLKLGTRFGLIVSKNFTRR